MKNKGLLTTVGSIVIAMGLLFCFIASNTEHPPEVENEMITLEKE